MDEKVLIVKYGEIATRGKNRNLFVKQLVDAIRRNIDSEGNFYVVMEQGRLIVEDRSGGTLEYDRVVPGVNRVMGILGVCPGIKVVDQSLENLCRAAFEHMKNTFGDKKMTFKVLTKRSNKRYPIESTKVSALVGEYILDRMPNLSVDIHHPDETLVLELRNDAYIYSKFVKGHGGLPYGSSGRGVTLLSGGIDSPVATYMMAKRGVALEGVYFHSPPYTSERAKQKVVDLAEVLSQFMGGFRLHVVPFTALQLYLLENVPEDKLTIFLKRSMMRAAEAIAEANRGLCLVTGDSIGQVASQTVHGIHAINAACEMPVLRPLAGMDKQEIIDIANRIGTFDISIQPYEDCCTIFVAKHPETRPKTSVIEGIEEKLEELPKLLQEALENTEIIDI